MSIVGHSQFSGNNTKGDYGLLSGSQLPPGFWLNGPMYIRYDADTLRNSEGDRVGIDPDRPGSVTVNAYTLGIIWVSEFKILGGNYSFQIWPALAVPGFTAYDGKFGSMEFAVNMRGAYFFDTRTGEIWNYIGEGGNIVVQKLGTVARMGEPLQ